MSSTLGHPDEQEFGLGYDGTTMYFGASGSGDWTNLTARSNAELKTMNDWSTATALNFGVSTILASPPAKFGLLFPEARNISGWSIGCYMSSSSITLSNLEISTDATSLSTGTWNLMLSGTFHATSIFTAGSINYVAMRQPSAVSWSNVVGIRWQGVTGGSGVALYLAGFHLWGTCTRPGLEFIDATNPTAMNGKNFDFGDALQGSVITRTFRIRNNNALTANSVVVGTPGIGNGAIVGTVSFSDGGAYTSSLDIGNLAPGAISSVLSIRHTVAGNASLAPSGTRVTAIAGSWS